MRSPKPYTPLDRDNLGRSVADALLGAKPEKLGELAPFFGAGIYAIYYEGGFPAYERLAEVNRGGACRVPIYIGKAIPGGARKGGTGTSGSYLYGRLREHAESIEHAQNLHIGDFWCRYLVVEDIWIPLGESLLIARFSPLWNALVDGFGNHDPGKGRYKGMRPRWDVLHPGRIWAEKCKPRPETTDQIAVEISVALEADPRWRPPAKEGVSSQTIGPSRSPDPQDDLTGA